ncbi:MAG TPA: hypothetical protein VKL21_01775 [Candidatus Methanoperedens sp.]|nr:hypothetical protein [Candidatus Methanoperedens sp.]
MGTVSSKKRLEIIERDVIPSMFVGVLAKDDKWLEHTLKETLPLLEERALRLARECKESGECAQDDPLVNETRIKALFEDARSKLGKEHLTREAHSRYSH